MPMNRLVKRLDDTLALIEKSAIIICFALLAGCVLMGILSRNFFHLPIHRLFESAPHLVLWIALLGASQALKQQRHIRLELFLRYCSNRFRHWTARLVNLFGALVMAVLLFPSIEFVNNEIAMFGRWGGLAIIFPIFFMSTGFRYLTAAFFPAAPFVSNQVGLLTTPNR
jgi:TRAP-type C4-dicarboxylate transport system permease small subunit